MCAFYKTEIQTSENTFFRSESKKETLCAWPGCSESGCYPAPRDRVNLRDYLWFCRSHIRIYNRHWNYCQGMSEEQITNLARGQATWERPTWQLGSHAPLFCKHHHIYDNISDHVETNQKTRKPPPEDPPRDSFESTSESEIDSFDFSSSSSEEDIKNRYRQLAKKLHPDTNGGDKNFEERLKLINEAYSEFKRRRRAQRS